MIEPLRRHDLLCIDPASWEQALRVRPDLSADPMIASWADNGWPVIVRRFLPTDSANQIPVAISLPPMSPLPRLRAKRGATLQFAADQITSRVPAVSLRDGIIHAPGSWAGALQTLIEIGECYDSEPALFGSLLWQTLTGATYLNESSDLDLTWQVTRYSQAVALARAIAACADSSPMRIDGELVLPDGAAVNWRECHNTQEVMVKTLHRVECRTAQSLFA
jgi:phosphoribosyl-dephospho-CoA transferase